MRNFASREFLLFLGTGGVAAAVNFGSRFLYNRFMGFSSAVIFAYITGMITAFILAKLFVFRKTQHSTARSAFYFTLVNAIALFQTWIVSLFLADKLLPALGVHRFVDAIAHLVGITVPVFTSYIGHKRFSFKE
jgi:putative flippase GtrA